MLSPKKRTLVKEILKKMAIGAPVSLEERKYLHKCADQDQTISSWHHMARKQSLKKRNETKASDSLENLLDEYFHIMLYKMI